LGLGGQDGGYEFVAAGAARIGAGGGDRSTRARSSVGCGSAPEMPGCSRSRDRCRRCAPITLLAMDSSMIASFSRALLEGLSDKPTDEQFNTQLDASVSQIFEASVKKSRRS
jgi:hypothetical protein